MAYNDPQLLHLDTMLTNISVGFDPGQLVSEVLFPPVEVNKQSDKWYVFARESWQLIDDIRTPGARANEVPTRSLSRDSYFAEEHALVDVVPPEDQENADGGIDVYIESTEGLTTRILMNRENAMVTMATTAANYNASNTTTLSGTAQWSDYGTTSDPIANMKTARDRVHSLIYRKPNLAVMGYQVAAKLEDHPDLIERIKYSGKDTTTDEIFARLFNIERIVRAEAGKLTNALGQAETTGYMWGKDVVVAYVPSSPGKKTPAYAYEFVWPIAGKRTATERWFDNDHNADKVRVRRRYDLKPVYVDGSGKFLGGYLIKAAVA